MKAKYKRVQCAACGEWFAENWIARHQETKHFMPADKRKILITNLRKMGQTPEERPDVVLP